MEKEMLEQMYVGRIVPWTNRNDKNEGMEQSRE